MLSDEKYIPEKAKNAVIFIHGYGADGKDLIGLGRELMSDLPQTAFFAPNGIKQMMFGGYEWFSLDDYNPNTALTLNYLEILTKRATESVSSLIEYVETISKTYNIPIENITLAGFSQGGLMSFLTAYKLKKPIRALIGMSAVPLIQKTQTDYKIPVLLTHGNMDDIVPIQALSMSAETFKLMDQDVKTVVSPFMSHGIDEVCFSEIKTFLKHIYND